MDALAAYGSDDDGDTDEPASSPVNGDDASKRKRPRDGEDMSERRRERGFSLGASRHRAGWICI